MVVHGEDNTLPISLDMMIVHCKAVKRGSNRIFVIGDLPFGSYEESVQQALSSAMRLVKEGGVDAVKLEGGSISRIDTAGKLIDAGIAVVGHVGLTPQSIGVLGGFRAQGKTAKVAMEIFQAALKLQDVGCFAVVLECIPKPLADVITRALKIPTIGIGAGNGTSGQILVFHDLLGFTQHPHHEKMSPKFCKQYAKVGENIHLGLNHYVSEVSTRSFPNQAFSPYEFEAEEHSKFLDDLREAGFTNVLT